MSFSVLPESGNVFLTEFVFTFLGSATSYAWDFGDGSVAYNGPSTTYTYRYPGTYVVSNSAWDDSGNAPTVYQQTITVDYVYPNKINFVEMPSEYSVPGLKTSTPFVVSLTCTEINQPIYLSLQALNTNSIPVAYVPPKWQRITPKWQFIDATSGNVVTDGLLVNTSPIYQTFNGEQVVVAVSGVASFYYVDDLPTRFDSLSSSPLLLIATLSTENFISYHDSQIYPYPSYANSDAAKVGILWQVGEYFPTNLKVTENFISDVYPLKWTNVPIPTMVTCLFDSSLNPNFVNVTPLTANLLEYPRTNDIGSSFPLTLSLTNNLSSSLESSSLYFSNTDEKGNINSGYVYTSITPLVSANNSIKITAATQCVEPNSMPVAGTFQFPIGYPIYSDAYVNSPYNTTIDKVSLVNCPFANKNINFYKNLGVLVDGKLTTWISPGISSVEVATPQTLSAAPIHGIAVDPITNAVYITDPVTGNISSFDRFGKLYYSTNFSFVLSGEPVSPGYISVDGQQNVWVSTYEKETIYKLDNTLNYITRAIPSTYTTDIQLVAPPIAEPDMYGNLWACYAETSASYLVQYDTNGTQLTSICLSSYSDSLPVPVSLAIDANNGVWVACYNANMLLNFASDGTYITTVSSTFTRPNFVSVDRSNNIWFVNGYNFITKYNPSTTALTTWQYSTNSQSFYQCDESAPYNAIPTDNEKWGGMTIDVYDRVWLVDSKRDNTIVFNSNDNTNLTTLRTLPNRPTVSVSLPTPNTGLDIPTSHTHSSQAVGDFTGNKWYQKYAIATYIASVSGTSAPFNVLDLNASYNVSKVNEEFNMSSYFQSLALPESLARNVDLFEQFLAAVVGNGDPTKESMGRVVYERIANFVQTHADIETAEIDQLLSFANQLSVGARTYGITFPAEVNRLINLFSVPKKTLRGRLNYTPNVADNIGSILTETDIVSAGQHIFSHDKRYNTYGVIYVSPLDYDITNAVPLSAEQYPIAMLSIAGYRTPLLDNYYFFRYEPKVVTNDQTNGSYNVANTTYTENIINWDSLFTTFDYTLSTNEEWYGDNGLVENMFNKILTKGLIK